MTGLIHLPKVFNVPSPNGPACAGTLDRHHADSWTDIGGIGNLAALDDFFQQTGHDYHRFNYLGEWHSHPGFPPLPSTTDIDSMEDLVAGERGIDFGVLLIVKLTLFRRFALSMTLHRRGHAPEAVNLHIGS